MLKILFVTATVVICLLLLCFPFWHVGGHYYRGLLLIYDIRPKSGGGFLPPLPFERDITLLHWVDPSSFQYVGSGYGKDRFSVYADGYKLKDFDSQTFRAIQAPVTGEWFYLDRENVRAYSLLLLKAVLGERLGDGKDIVTEKFDTMTFEPIGANFFKDKNGVYSYFRPSPFVEDMGQANGWGNRTIILLKKHDELDVQTFKVNSCENNTCFATDKNGVYSFNKTDGVTLIKIKKISN